MNAGEARRLAERWVAEEIARSPGEVLGAFTWGSVNWMADADPFPASSDLDIAVVIPKVDPVVHRVRKRPYGGVAVEPYYVAREQFLSVEELLAQPGLAPNLVDGKLLFDPEGMLGALRAAMVPEFARRAWIRQRCRSQRDEALRFVEWAEKSERLLFVIAVGFRTVQSMAQMALIADLGNPTVKKALVKARRVLAAYGLAEEHLGLLRMLGSAALDDRTILAASARCRSALDQACRWRRTPFGADLHVTADARPSLDVDLPACVAEGTGREMFLWVATLHTLSMMALDNDAPSELAAAAWKVYLGDMALLGVASMEDARARLSACRPALERFTEVCDDIVSRNPRALA